LEGAIQDYTEADHLKPDNIESYKISSDLYMDKGFSEDEDIKDYYYEENLFKHESARLHWLRGMTRYKEGDFDGAITDFSETVLLESNFHHVYLQRGLVHRRKGNFDKATADYDKAIEVEPDNFTAYYERGLLHQLKGELDKALADFTNTILIKPDHAVARTSLLGILKKLGREDEAKEHEQIALIFIQKEEEYNRACFEAIRGKIDMALKLLEISFTKEPSVKKWAKQDPDLENIRDDPRFKKLVGE